jgi:hypothetical protein
VSAAQLPALQRILTFITPGPRDSMGIVAAWQTSNSPYLAAGHSLRMAMDLGLHRALGKIAEDDADGRVRSNTEQRSLVVSARTFLCLYWLDLVLSVRPTASDCGKRA